MKDLFETINNELGTKFNTIVWANCIEAETFNHMELKGSFCPVQIGQVSTTFLRLEGVVCQNPRTNQFYIVGNNGRCTLELKSLNYFQKTIARIKRMF